MNRMKAAAEWFRDTVFKDEAIRPGAVPGAGRLPAMLRTARSLENNAYQNWQSRETVFLKQAKLLANYEDECDYQGTVQRYYPTYQALTDRELRGYFSWRTKLRRGDVQKTSLTYAFLYIYELLNQIGAEDPMEGYRRLVDFRDVYGRLDAGILPHLSRWLVDYVIYYGLDPALLAGSPQVIWDRSITVLEYVQEQGTDKVAEAVRQLAPKWLARSRFYGAYREDMDEVIVRVLRRMSAHYAARCKKTMVEQYFDSCRQYPLRIFEAAVFCDPLKRRNYEYVVDEQCVYRCKKGVWTVWGRAYSPPPGEKLTPLLKAIDSVMREEYGYRHPIKADMDTKWILQTIREEIRALQAEKRAAEEKKVTIDYGQLTQIRRDAAITREKLIVEEETDAPEEPAEQVRGQMQAEEEGPEGGALLSPAEYRLLHDLLYGGDTGWVQASGHLMSVLVDGVNEKLYDQFQDSVLDDTPQVIEDYIDDLKEMVRP